MSEVTFTILNSGKIFYDGVEFQPSYVAKLKEKYKSRLIVNPKRYEIVTRSKSLGAIADGIDTVVDVKISTDFVELVIDVPWKVEVELYTEVMKSLDGNDPDS